MRIEEFFLKKNRRSKGALLPNPDFAEALYEDRSGHSSFKRQYERKTQQLCRQVQRALNLALGGGDLFVEEVSPAPDCGHLLVQVAIPHGLPVEDVVLALSRETPRLRAEVASAITRKRAPELFFVPVGQEGGRDE